MDIEQLLTHIVRPTLQKIGMHSVAAERLVMGTIAQESRATYVKQLGNGPAMGLAQMEPATHEDIWEHYLKYKPEMAAKIAHLASVGSLNELHRPDANELIGNVVYAVAMCRVHYRRFPAALPDADDLPAMAAYWKRYYNTVKGAGTEEEFLENFPRVILQ